MTQTSQRIISENDDKIIGVILKSTGSVDEWRIMTVTFNT